MWRNIAILAVVIGAITLAACKSDYKCTCKVLGVSADTVFTGVTKKEAKAKCDEIQQDINQLDPNATCDISKAK